MKAIIAALVVVTALAIPTMLGFIPVFLGVPAMLLTILLKDVIFLVFARGLPMAIISTRMMGGLLWGVVRRKEIVVDRFIPEKGMVQTKKSGDFTVVPQRLIKIAGVWMGLAPEKVGYNVGLDHVELVNQLKKRGITDIRDIIDTNEFGQAEGIKDDKRIRDIRDKLKASLEQMDLSGFDDFYRYCAEAANPYHQEAMKKIGIAQGVLGKGEKSPWPWIAAIVFIGFIGLAVLYMLTGGGGEVKVVVENASHVIPV